MKKKRILISVINDLVTDQRVHRHCTFWEQKGYYVTLIGRKKKNSPPMPDRKYRHYRMRLFFEKGVAFYFFFQLRLFFTLLIRKKDILLANDLDTLGPNYLISKLFGIPLIYDSHEIFCEVPELKNSPFKKKCWEWIEKRMVPELPFALTVNTSIAEWFQQKYGIPFYPIRNVPFRKHVASGKNKEDLQIPQDKHILMMQGAGINMDRGAEELLEAMRWLDDCHLFIIGGGDVFPYLKQRAAKEDLKHKITILDKLPPEKLQQYTVHADLGLSLDKDNNINYHYSLPNKLFDFIQAGVPILSTRLPEIEKLIQTWQIGTFIKNHDPESLAISIKYALKHPEYKNWKQQCKKAAAMEHWEQETQVLEQILFRNGLLQPSD